MSAASVERLEVAAGPWRVELVPERGASLTRLAWTHPDGATREILRRPSPDQIDDRAASLSLLSSFLMLPFANRIDGARFEYDGLSCALPLNRPQQDCAIHGHSREHVWRVVERDADRLVCEDLVSRDDTPFRYRAELSVTATPEQVTIGVSVENRADRALPYGFGLHPWFPRTPESRLRFDAANTFTPDPRTFPVARESLGLETDFSAGLAPESRIGLDRHYAGWSGTADIRQPDLGYAATLSGDGAFRNLHIYVAGDRPDFCVEPVSHVTDVVNRRAFAEDGDMARLEPGARLAGVATLRAAPL